jgi:hypothetical protein
MPFIVTADGAQLAYESSGQGAPVLFGNGVMVSTDMWDNARHRPGRGGAAVA